MGTAVTALQLLLVDSRSPAGAHGHSGGMEPAVTAGFVRGRADVEEFCRGRLRTAGAVAAGAAAAAVRLAVADADADAWQALDQDVTARTASEAARTASRALGSGLLRLARTVLPQLPYLRWFAAVPPPAPHHPVVLGSACAVAGADAMFAARAAALGVCTAPATAAVRLLGFDPYAIHGMLARLGPEIDEVAAAAASASRLPAGCAPALELLADVHAQSEVRLFAS